MGIQLPPPKKKGDSAQIFGPSLLWPNGCMDQDATTEVGLGQRDIVLYGDPAPPPLKGHRPPIFSQCPLLPNDWMNYDSTWYGGRPRPRRLCVQWGPSYPQKKGHTYPTQFLANVYCGQVA